MIGKKKDFYTQRAKDEGMIARSAYKLKQINNRFHILKPGNKILDLGCSPGGWSKLSLDIVGASGSVVGVDTAPVKLKDSRFTFIQADIFEEEILNELERDFNVVVSDAAPKTTGQRELDRERSEAIAFYALKVAEKKLVPGGHFVCKIFQGQEYQKFLQKVSKKFHYTRSCKPDASKRESKEMYIVGKGYKG